jgi:hypothetical protein
MRASFRHPLSSLAALLLFAPMPYPSVGGYSNRVSDGLRVVREGLKPGETIIVEGLQRVRPGMTVQPTAVPMDPKERPKPDPAAKK